MSKVNGADNVNKWIEGNRRTVAKKRGSIMTGLKDSLDTELGPRHTEIVKREAPFLTFAIGMALENKPIDAIAFAKVTLVVLPLVLVDNLLVELKERWKKGVRCLVGGERVGTFRNE